MADSRPEALFFYRLHCGGGAAMTAERARCNVYAQKSVSVKDFPSIIGPTNINVMEIY